MPISRGSQVLDSAGFGDRFRGTKQDHAPGPVTVEDPFPTVRSLRRLQPAQEVGYPSVRMLDTNEEPRRPVVSGDRPGPSHSVRGDPPLGRLIDSAGLVFLQLSRAVPRYSLNNHQAARSVSASGSGQMMRELTWISQNLSDRRPSAARSRPPVRSAGLSCCYLYLVTILLVGFG